LGGRRNRIEGFAGENAFMPTLTSDRPASIRISLWEDPARAEIAPISYESESDTSGDRDIAVAQVLARLLELPSDATPWLGGLLFATDDFGPTYPLHDRRGFCREVIGVNPDGHAGALGYVVAAEQ
jgi:hypothetical protein